MTNPIPPSPMHSAVSLSSHSTHPEAWGAFTPTTVRFEPPSVSVPPASSPPCPRMPELALTSPQVAPSVTPPSLHPVVSTTQRHASGNGVPMPPPAYGAPPFFSGHAPMYPGSGCNGAPMFTGSGCNGAPTPFSQGPPMRFNYSAHLPPGNGTLMPFSNGGHIPSGYGAPMLSGHYPPMHPNSTSMYTSSGYGSSYPYGSCGWNPPQYIPSMHGYPPFAMSQPPVHPAPWSDSHHLNSGGWNSSSQSHSAQAPTPSAEHASTATVPERAQKGVRYLRAEEIKEVLDDHQYPSYLIHTVTAPAYCTHPDARDLSYYVGGKPTFDFSGLEPAKVPSPATCKRTVLGGAEDSAATAGLSLKLTRDTDFPAWLEKFTAACSSYGLDTCLYLNPHNRGMQLIGRCLPFCDDIIMQNLDQHRRFHMQTNRLYLSEERLIHKKLVDSIGDAHLRDFYDLHAHLVDEKPTAPIIVVLFHLYMECTGGTAKYMNSIIDKFDRLQVFSSTGGLVGALTEFTFLLKKMEEYGHYPLHAITRLTELARSAPPYQGFSLQVARYEDIYNNTVPTTFKFATFHQRVAFLRRHGIHPIEIAQTLSKSYRTYTNSDPPATSHAEVHNPHQAHYTSASSDTTSAELAAAEAAHQESIRLGKETKRRLIQLKQNHSASTPNSNTSNNRRNSSSHSRGGNRGGRGRNENRSSPHRNRPPRSESHNNTGDTAASSDHCSRSTQSDETKTVSTAPPTLTASYVLDNSSADDDLPQATIVPVSPSPTSSPTFTDAALPTFIRFNVFTQSEVQSTPLVARVSIPPTVDITALLASGPEVGDALPFVFNIGATVNIVPDASDFLPGTLRSPKRQIPVQGLASSTHVAGIGIIAVDFPAIDGSLRRFEMEAYHIPDSNVPRIISPQVYLDQQKARNNDEWPERFMLSGADACFVYHPTAPDLKISRGSSGLYVGYGKIASSSAAVMHRCHRPRE